MLLIPLVEKQENPQGPLKATLVKMNKDLGSCGLLPSTLASFGTIVNPLPSNPLLFLSRKLSIHFAHYCSDRVKQGLTKGDA